MATIAQIVEQIRTAIYGKDVRENIAQGIEKCYTDTVDGVNAATTAASSANAAASTANTAASTATTAASTANAAASAASEASNSLDDVRYSLSYTNKYISNPEIDKKTVTTGVGWTYSTVFQNVVLLSNENYVFTFAKTNASEHGYGEIYVGSSRIAVITLRNKTIATYEYKPVSDVVVTVKVGFENANITTTVTIGHKISRLDTMEGNAAKSAEDLFTIRETSVSIVGSTANASVRGAFYINKANQIHFIRVNISSAQSNDIDIWQSIGNTRQDKIGTIRAGNTNAFFLFTPSVNSDKIEITQLSGDGATYSVSAYTKEENPQIFSSDILSNNTAYLIPNSIIDENVGEVFSHVYNSHRLATKYLIPAKNISSIIIPAGWNATAMYFDSMKRYLSKYAWTNLITSDDINTANADFVGLVIRNQADPTGYPAEDVETVQAGIKIENKIEEPALFAQYYDLKYSWGRLDSAGVVDLNGHDFYLIAMCALRGAKKVYTNNYYNSTSTATIVFYGISNTDVKAVYVKPNQRVFDVPFGAKYFAISSNTSDYKYVWVGADHIDKRNTNDITPNEKAYIGERIFNIYNPYHESHNNWYMGQMHSHSWGWETPEGDTEQGRIDYYNSLVNIGYDFGTLTNYYKVTPNPVPNGNLVWMFESCEQSHSNNVINGDEPGDHTIMWNTPVGQSGIGTPQRYPSCYFELSDMIDVYKGVSVLSLAHPMWVNTTLSSDQAKRIKGLRYTEVFSGSVGWPDTEGETWSGNPDDAWNMILSAGNYCFALGVADGHSANDGFLYRGNIKLNASQKDRLAIFDSFLKGNFYAASATATSINGVSFSNGVYTVNTGNSNAAVYFYGKNRTLLKSATGSTVSYTLSGDEPFVYAYVVLPSEITGQSAVFTQPVFLCENMAELAQQVLT